MGPWVSGTPTSSTTPIELTVRKVAAGERTGPDSKAGRDGAPDPMRGTIEGPEEVLATTYSNCTWQNRTFDAARAVARGDRGQLQSLGLQLGLFGYPLCGDDEWRRHLEEQPCSIWRTTTTNGLFATSACTIPHEA